jgi:Transcriptional regulators
MANETINTISKRTGYSVSTVSRALSGQAEKYRISKKAVEIICQEAKRCNYVPSLLAKSLRMSKTNTIGLLVPNLDNPYFANMSTTIIVEAKAHGFSIVLVNSMEEEKNEKESLNLLCSRKVDGIIAVPSGHNAKVFEDVIEKGIPVVLIDRYFENSNMQYVTSNNYLGAVEATKYLVENGHKRIVCIQGPSFLMPVKERVRGFWDIVSDSGINDCAKVVGGEFSIQSGYVETKLVINSSDRPTAIFVLSNTILLGAIKAIRESGLTIPEDISIISFDDNKYLDFLDPAITRVAQSVEEIGILSVKLIMQNINNKEGTSSNIQIQVPPTLIVCNSVKSIR